MESSTDQLSYNANQSLLEAEVTAKLRNEGYPAECKIQSRLFVDPNTFQPVNALYYFSDRNATPVKLEASLTLELRQELSIPYRGIDILEEVTHIIYEEITRALMNRGIFSGVTMNKPWENCPKTFAEMEKHGINMSNIGNAKALIESVYTEDQNSYKDLQLFMHCWTLITNKPFPESNPKHISFEYAGLINKTLTLFGEKDLERRNWKKKVEQTKMRHRILKEFKHENAKHDIMQLSKTEFQSAIPLHINYKSKSINAEN